MDDPEATEPIPTAELRQLIQAFGQLATASGNLMDSSSGIPERIGRHLAVDPATVPSVSLTIPPVDRPNVQLAIDRIVAEQPEAALIGLSPELSHYGGFSLSAILAGRFRGPTEEVPPVYDDLPVDVDETLRCLSAGLWLLHHDATPVVLGLAPGGHHHGPPEEAAPRVEIFAADLAIAEAFKDRLQDLRAELNVYRGKVLAFSFNQYGGFGVTFTPRPTTAASDVVLPDADLASIQRQTLGIERRAEKLRAAGQHLTRGLLLHGPPGSGKTHTVGYLMAAMADRTVVLLQGPSIGALGQGAAIVRTLAPSMLVIEDVDLIATDRDHYAPGGGNPLLFQLLNEMDGLTTTDDVLYVLTTNRREVLEHALASRPGRIDHSVKIDLPDTDGRRRLLDIYLRDTPNAIDDVDAVLTRTEGVTASAIKELIRRAALESIEEAEGLGAEQPTIVDRHIHAALDDMAAYSATGTAEPADRPEH